MTNPHHTYRIGSHSLEPSDYQKDLGVIVDSKFSFHRHCASVVSKANQRFSIEANIRSVLYCHFKSHLFENMGMLYGVQDINVTKYIALEKV